MMDLIHKWKLRGTIRVHDYLPAVPISIQVSATTTVRDTGVFFFLFKKNKKNNTKQYNNKKCTSA